MANNQPQRTGVNRTVTDEDGVVVRELSDLEHDMSQHDGNIKAPQLTNYLAKLDSLEPLPAERQLELARQYKKDEDLEAARLLILTNLRLVVKLAKEYHRKMSNNLLDLIQEGNVGLSRAVQKFDPEKGVKFTSYAQYWIRSMILNHIMNHTGAVRIGGTRAGRKLFYNLKKARRHLRRRGLEPTTERVAEYLDVDEKEVTRVGAQLDSSAVSLEQPAPGREGSMVRDTMEADVVSPEDEAADRQVAGRFAEAIDKFGRSIEDDRRRAIWHERMIADDQKTLADLGEDWDVSKERIRQVEVQIRDEFRDFLKEEVGEDVDLKWKNMG
ncbi:MAG: sigma-70 family RNA polymerase sigma factor [Myxococcota bacterium]